MFKAAILLSQQYNITNDEKTIGWRFVEDEGNPMKVLRGICRQISNSNIVGIVGPPLSREAHIIAPFAAELGIPVISYASTAPELSDRKAYPTFYRTVPSDNAAALSIAKLFTKFNWTSCIIIYQNDAFGSGGAKAISETFNKNNLTVAQMIVFDIVTQAIRGNLRNLLISSPSRIVILWADIYFTQLILQEALNADVIGPHFAWLLSSNVPLNSFSQKWSEKLIGMLIVEPVVGSFANVSFNTTLLDAAYSIWQTYENNTFPGKDKVNSYALFAFDATWTLIQSLQQLCSRTTDRSSSCISLTNTSFCFNRRFLNSSLFLNIMNTNSFLGVSGFVQFSDNITDRIDGVYYVLRNVQRSGNDLDSVPVLVLSDSDGWKPGTLSNTLRWPGNTDAIPESHATLSGITLQIALIEADPFTMIKEEEDENGQITKKRVGYIPDLIVELTKKMNFTANITILPSNSSYNGLIDAVANNLYDMVIGDVTITAIRREKVCFSSSIFDNSLRIVMRSDLIYSVDYLALLRSFSSTVWITILCAVLGSIFLIYLFEREENEALKDRPIISQIGLSTWYCFGSIMGYDVGFYVRTVAARLLVGGLYILSLVLVAAYTANLTSNLTIAKSQGIINGIEDIKNGRIPFHRIGIHNESSIEAYYLRDISSGIRNFYPLASKQDMYNKLLNNIIDASIMDAGNLEYTTSSVYCNLTLVGTDFDRSAFGIVFQKNWPYEQALDIALLSLRESGLFDNLKSKWFQSSYCSRLHKTSPELPIEGMAGLFLMFAIICSLSLLLFTWLKRSIIKGYLLKLNKKLPCPVIHSIQTSPNDSITKPSFTIVYF